MPSQTHQAIVIGAGITGLSAAIALAEKGVQAALVDDGYLGGLITNVGVLEAPGPFDGLSGADLAGDLLGRAMEAGADYQMGEIAALERSDDGLWSLPNLQLAAPAIVLATGAALRTLGVPGEERLTGLGVSQCAFCDGGLYAGQPVTVVGGGDSAFQEALHLAEIGCTVTLLLRGNHPRARAAFIERAEAAANLAIRTGCEVREILGADGVDAVRIRDAASAADETIPTRAVFVFVGLAPRAGLAPAEALRDATGALVTDQGRETAAPGLYAVGAVRAGFGGGLNHAGDDAHVVAEAIAGR